MTPRNTSLVVLATLVAASIASAEQKNQVNYVPDFYCVSGPHGLRLPSSYADLRRLGRLKSERLTATQDWDKYKTHERELVFDGLRLYVITFTNEPDRYMIAGAEITDRHWNLTGNLRIGDSIDEARRKLNAKSNPKADPLEFGGDSDSVVFKVSGGRIIAISYGCYTG